VAGSAAAFKPRWIRSAPPPRRHLCRPRDRHAARDRL